MKKASITVNFIGAGLSNLICASYLSKQGINVNIFESQSECGGVIGVIKRKDYFFEKSTHQTGGFGVKHYIKNLIKKTGINDLELVKMPYIYESFFVYNNEITEKYLLPSGKQSLKNMLIENFPDSKNQIEEFFHIIEKITRDTIRIMRVEDLSTSIFKIIPILIDAITALFLKNGKANGLISKIGQFSYKYLAKYYNSTFSELIKSFDKKLQLLLSQYCSLCDLKTGNTPAILMAVIFYIFYFDAPYLIKNGTKIFIDKLINIIKSNDGKIYLNKNISKIILDNKGKATGLEADNGEKYYCDKIVAGISPQKVFFEMIGSKSIDKEYVKNLKKLDLSQSGFLVYIGLPLTLDDYGIKASCNLYHYVDKNFSSDFELQKNDFLLTNFSKLDNFYSPEGKSSISIFKFDDYSRWTNLSEMQYKKQKNETEENIIEKAEKLTNIPFKKKAEIIFSATPLTIKRYMGNYCGEVYASRRTVDQNFEKRTPTETPIENLFLGGAYESPGSGIPAVIENGYFTAKKILKDI